jgi:hypothetical protein
MKFPIQLPDEAKTLIIRDGGGEFRGQATYWKRSSRWSMIGVTRSMKWLHETEFQDVKAELKKRGYTFEWKQAHPFTTDRMNTEGTNYGWMHMG